MVASAIQLENPYQTPEAVLTDSSAIQSTTLYVVSKKKLAILFLCTVSLHTLYWFYENWRRVKRDTGERIWPAPRAIFNIFFAHKLFKHIHTEVQNKGQQVSWSHKSLALLYVALSIVGHVAENVSDMVSLLSLLFLPVFLNIFLQIQESVNASQGDLHGEMNSRFTLANYLWCVFGLMIWAVVLISYAETFGLISIPAMEY